MTCWQSYGFHTVTATAHFENVAKFLLSLAIAHGSGHGTARLQDLEALFSIQDGSRNGVMFVPENRRTAFFTYSGHSHWKMTCYTPSYPQTTRSSHSPKNDCFLYIFGTFALKNDVLYAVLPPNHEIQPFSQEWLLSLHIRDIRTEKWRVIRRPTPTPRDPAILPRMTAFFTYSGHSHWKMTCYTPSYPQTTRSSHSPKNDCFLYILGTVALKNGVLYAVLPPHHEIQPLSQEWLLSLHIRDSRTEKWRLIRHPTPKPRDPAILPRMTAFFTYSGHSHSKMTCYTPSYPQTTRSSHSPKNDCFLYIFGTVALKNGALYAILPPNHEIQPILQEGFRDKVVFAAASRPVLMQDENVEPFIRRFVGPFHRHFLLQVSTVQSFIADRAQAVNRQFGVAFSEE